MTKRAHADALPRDEHDVGDGLTARVARGVFWNYASLLLVRGGGLLTTVVLAHLLTPRDFGWVAYAVIALDLARLVQDLGLGAALIQRPSLREGAADTAFTLGILLAVPMTLATLAIAFGVGAWWGEAQVAALLVALAPCLAIDALGAVHLNRLRRELDFRTKLAADTARTVVKAVVAIACAFGGLGVWALVIGQLAGALACSAAAWRLYPWRPRLRIEATAARELLRFGGPIAVCNVLAVIGTNAALLVAGSFGAEALGAYSVADRIVTLVVASLMWVAAEVLLPAYAQLFRTAADRIHVALLATVRLSALVYVPLALGISLSADLLVPVVLGDHWAAAIAPLQILALSALVSALNFHVGDMLKGMGRTGLVLRIAILELALLVPATLAGASFGLAGIAAARLATELVVGVAQLAAGLPLVGVTAAQYVRALRPAFVGAVAMALAMQAVRIVPLAPGGLGLACVLAAGAFAYGAVVWMLDRTVVASLVGLSLSLRGRARLRPDPPPST